MLSTSSLSKSLVAKSRMNADRTNSLNIQPSQIIRKRATESEK